MNDNLPIVERFLSYLIDERALQRGTKAARSTNRRLGFGAGRLLQLLEQLRPVDDLLAQRQDLLDAAGIADPADTHRPAPAMARPASRKAARR